MKSQVRVLVLGAHPDDAEFHAGGLLCNHARQGSVIRMISVTDGRSGHQTIDDETLVARRREEASRAGAIIESEYLTWDFPDGYLQPNVEVRNRIIYEMRTFKPDLVLTHRTCDYHPDHRAVGIAVQDASYLVTVPKIVPEAPALARDPIVAYMPDLFTRPNPLRTDVVLDASRSIQSIVDMLACHESQVFDWLPYNQGILDKVPTSTEARKAWLRDWYLSMVGKRGEAFWHSDCGPAPQLVEAYEISEYAGKLSAERMNDLFPGHVKPTN